MGEKTVDNYICGLDGWQQSVALRARSIIRETLPEAEEAIKWGQPVYSIDGPLAYFKAFKSSVNIGFWRGAEMEDPGGLLTGSGERMRHLKVTSETGLDQESLREFLLQGAELNRTQGDPTRG